MLSNASHNIAVCPRNRVSEQCGIYAHLPGRWYWEKQLNKSHSGIKYSVYCSPALPLGKKKNNPLLINTGHLVVCLSIRQLPQPVLTDVTLPCIWCSLVWRTRRVSQVCSVWYMEVAYVSSLDCSPCSAWNIASRLQASKNDSGCISYKCCEYIMHSIVCMNPFTC